MAMAVLRKFALFSPVLPPIQGGQPIILHRILECIDPSRYVLIGDYEFQQARSHATALAKGNREAVQHFIHSITDHPRLPQKRSQLFRFPFDARREIRGRTRSIERILKDEGCDLLIGCTGDAYSFVASERAARRGRVRYVPYLFDDFGYQGPRFMRPMLRLWERHILRSGANVIVTNESAARMYRRRHDVHCSVVHNAAPRLDLKALDAVPPKFAPGTFNIVFTGTLYAAHYDAFHHIISAITRLKRPQVKLHVFTAQPAEQLAASGIAGEMVVYHPYHGQHDIGAFQRQADLLFLPLAFRSPYGALLNTSSPGKMGEYLAMGRPLLVHAPASTFLSWYFRQYGCGNVVDTPDVECLSDVLRHIIDAPEAQKPLIANAMARAEADFSLEAARSDFQEALRKAMEAPACRSACR